MKKLQKLMVLILFMIITLFLSRVAQSQPNATVSFQTFYNELDPYGTWVNDPEYGYVWLPNAQSDFMPYGTNGYWVNTEYGNTWVSDYAWGWAPFHYGRWVSNNYYGWMWIPGNEWAPAWVAWRSGGGYYGWAPLGPNINISVSFNNYIPNHYWIFAPQHQICDRYISNYYVPRGNTVTIINNTTVINNVYTNNRFYTGPSIHDVRRASGKQVDVYAVNSSDRPGRTVVRDRSIEIYHPRVEHGNGRQVPSHVSEYSHRNNMNLNRNNYTSSSDFQHGRERVTYQSREQSTGNNGWDQQQHTRSSYNQERSDNYGNYNRTEQRDLSSSASRTNYSHSPYERSNQHQSNRNEDVNNQRQLFQHSSNNVERIHLVQPAPSSQREQRVMNTSVPQQVYMQHNSQGHVNSRSHGRNGR